MGFVSSVMGFFGFGIGITIGLVIGYYLFIYFQPRDAKDPVIRPFVEQDSQTLQRLLPEIPLWVKNPAFDRVDWLNKFIETMWPYLDKPHVDFGLKLLGAGAMSVPGLYRFVQKNRDPRWEEEFQFMLEERPTNDRIHVEVVSTSSRMGLLHPKEALGYLDINLLDVVANKRINERYHLIDSKNGRVQI